MLAKDSTSSWAIQATTVVSNNSATGAQDTAKSSKKKAKGRARSMLRHARKSTGAAQSMAQVMTRAPSVDHIRLTEMKVVAVVKFVRDVITTNQVRVLAPTNIDRDQ